jgi:polar amino acid transport system permease protein
MDNIINSFFNLQSLQLIYPLLIQGVWLTILLALIAAPLSILTGLTVAIAYTFGGKGLRLAILILIDFFRSFPVMLLLVVVFYGLPAAGIRFDAFTAIVVALVLNNTGYFGEIFRAGLASVDRGQFEASSALGMSRTQAMIHIILPQVVRNVLGPLVTNALELVKATSIASTVAVPELLRSARMAQEHTFNPTPLAAAALIYFVLLWPLSRWASHVEGQNIRARVR